MSNYWSWISGKGYPIHTIYIWWLWRIRTLVCYHEISCFISLIGSPFSPHSPVLVAISLSSHICFDSFKNGWVVPFSEVKKRIVDAVSDKQVNCFLFVLFYKFIPVNWVDQYMFTIILVRRLSVFWCLNAGFSLPRLSILDLRDTPSLFLRHRVFNLYGQCEKHWLIQFELL